MEQEKLNTEQASPSLLGVSWRIYCGEIGWGWRMYGIGYGTKWFCGLSIRAKTPEEIAEFYQAREKEAS